MSDRVKLAQNLSNVSQSRNILSKYSEIVPQFHSSVPIVLFICLVARKDSLFAVKHTANVIQIEPKDCKKSVFITAALPLCLFMNKRRNDKKNLCTRKMIRIDFASVSD